MAKELKEDYQRLLARAQALQAGLDSGRASGSEVLAQLNGLQADLGRLREEIDKKKVLVSAGKTYRQTDTTTFDLGAAKLLVITADRIRLEGWDEPQVKCVLEKSVLAPVGKPVEEHLREIRLVHHHGLAPNVVGHTSAQREADEQAFLAGPDGQKFTPDQRAGRRRLLDQIADRFAAFGSFQGKAIDTIEIEGLTYEQGNRNVAVDIESSGGEHSSSSQWQRDAALTVYVPSCEAIGLRGCRGSLDVHGIKGALVVTADGSRDNDYDGQFQIQDVAGTLTLKDAPINLVAGIRGNVSIRSTVEFVNTGETHDQNGITFYTPPPQALICRNIAGGLTASFTRAAVKLEGIEGRIDVSNEFGDTVLLGGRGLAKKAHRLISESGEIEVHISPETVQQFPLQALTSCGTVRVMGDSNGLHGTNFTVGSSSDGRSRNWRGMTSSERRMPMIGLQLERFAAVLENRERPPGLDVVSRCGVIRIVCDRIESSNPAR